MFLQQLQLPSAHSHRLYHACFCWQLFSLKKFLINPLWAIDRSENTLSCTVKLVLWLWATLFWGAVCSCCAESRHSTVFFFAEGQLDIHPRTCLFDGRGATRGNLEHTISTLTGLPTPELSSGPSCCEVTLLTTTSPSRAAECSRVNSTWAQHVPQPSVESDPGE